jgi:hypothetical protein
MLLFIIIGLVTALLPGLVALVLAVVAVGVSVPPTTLAAVDAFGVAVGVVRIPPTLVFATLTTDDDAGEALFLEARSAQLRGAAHAGLREDAGEAAEAVEMEEGVVCAAASPELATLPGDEGAVLLSCASDDRGGRLPKLAERS